jgi:dTDP-4-amino-4,6-dideoxygalactose transaminase
MAGPGLQCLGDEEKREVLAVLDSRELSRYRFDDDGTATPSKVFQFERALEAMTGARHCLGMNSCTSALLCGLWAAEIGPGCEVIVPGYTFIASIAAVAYAGATPILAEIDESLTLDADDVARKISANTKAILAVHMLGAPCNMAALAAIAEAHGLLLIEDCAQSGGGSFKERRVGTFGAFGAFSLNVFKTFTAGDGGVLLTSDTPLYERAFAIHDHGARPNRVGVADANSLLGLNFRMHEVTGAIAGAQLRKLPGILNRLRENKAKLLEAIGPLPRASERHLHDRNGECGTVAVYTFERAEVASTVAEGLGTITLAQSGKHNYALMPQLVRHALPVGFCPFDCDRQPLSANYVPGSLRRTDDLLARSVALSVGVVDSYLGTGFGVNLDSDDREIAMIAERFRHQVLQAQGVAVISQ